MDSICYILKVVLMNILNDLNDGKKGQTFGFLHIPSLIHLIILKYIHGLQSRSVSREKKKKKKSRSRSWNYNDRVDRSTSRHGFHFYNFFF